MARLRNVLLGLRQALCAHSFSIAEIKRTSPVSVQCPCERCGKVATAPYGIGLPGRLLG